MRDRPNAGNLKANQCTCIVQQYLDKKSQPGKLSFTEYKFSTLILPNCRRFYFL